MITAELIARINELARKQQEGLLTAEEQVEQANLRGLYIAEMRNRVKYQLDESLRHSHQTGCNCGCHGKH